jgi:hypothetical protein
MLEKIHFAICELRVAQVSVGKDKEDRIDDVIKLLKRMEEERLREINACSNMFDLARQKK